MKTAFFAVMFLLTTALCANLAMGDPVNDATSAPIIKAPAQDSMADATIPAQSAPVVKIADPVSDPGGWIDSVRTNYQNGSYLTVTLLILFGALIGARRYIAWLNVGKRAALVAAVLAMLTAVITALSGGATPSVSLFLNALAGGAALMWTAYAKPNDANATSTQ